MVLSVGDCCGSLSPSGTVLVSEGDSLSFIASPADGYRVFSGGGPSGEVCPHRVTQFSEFGDNTYQIDNVTSDCVLNVNFIRYP